MIDYNAITTAHMQNEPYRWSLLEQVIDPESLKEGERQYPLDAMKFVTRDSGSDKKYRFWVLPLIARDNKTAHYHQAAPYWQKLADHLNGTDYRQAVTTLVGTDLTRHKLDIGLFAYGANHGVSPHTDKKEKAANHIIYFNHDWQADWGGYFNALTAGHEEAVYQTVPPLAPYSVLLCRSDRSWHMVTKGRMPEGTARLTLQIEFWES